MIEPWPAILRPRRLMFHIQPMTQHGPRTFDGREQTGAPSAGFWIAHLGFRIWRMEQVREWRGFIASLEGGLNPFTIGVFDNLRDVGAGSLPAISAGIPHSDRSLFSDGTGYSQSNVEVEVRRNTAVRATSMSLTVRQAGTLRRGMYFSVEDRLYIITGILQDTGSLREISFRPELRIAAVAGAPVNFEAPRATMRLSKKGLGQLDLADNYSGQPEIDLEESSYGL